MLPQINTLHYKTVCRAGTFTDEVKHHKKRQKCCFVVFYAAVSSSVDKFLWMLVVNSVTELLLAEVQIILEI